MAKFQNKHLKLRYNHRAYFGDNDDCSIWHDGVGMRISCTISGVDPQENYHLATKHYVDNKAYDFVDLGDTPATLSGFGGYFVTVNSAGTALEFTSYSGIGGLICHSDLNCLDSDDHTIYVPVDGGRGFTATVSGIHPIQDNDLATKWYVDQQTDAHKETGRTALALNDSSKAVTFGTSFGDTNYSLSCILNNTTDGSPSIYPMIVTNRTATGFTVLFSGDIDSNNYYLEWIAVDDD